MKTIHSTDTINTINTTDIIFMVMSYMPVDGIKAKVRMNGIYKDSQSATIRQMEICNGIQCMNYYPNSIIGNNGMISWIKKVQLGDLEHYDVYVPDPPSRHTSLDA